MLGWGGAFRKGERRRTGGRKFKVAGKHGDLDNALLESRTTQLKASLRKRWRASKYQKSVVLWLLTVFTMKTQQVNFRVTNELKSAWIWAARSMRVKPTEFARFAIAKEIAAMYAATKTIMQSGGGDANETQNRAKA